jgi:hypothetical protein
VTTTPTFDELMDRLNAGQALHANEVAELAATPDILPLGMLADALRRRLHDTQVTYLRVASCSYAAPFTDAVLPAAREVRITGAPESLAIAVEAVAQARAIAGERVVAGFSWPTIESLAQGTTVDRVLAGLRQAGLDALAELPLDATGDAAAAIERLQAAGYQQVRLTLDRAPAADRVALFLRASELQDRFACIRSINPLPSTLAAFRPTTGYDDVKMVAIARLAAPNIATVQVDWLRYGPKLAQVALTFGADDFDGVTASDEAPDGRRRAPIEDVRRNIEAAGFTPAERDGRFAVVS